MMNLYVELKNVYGKELVYPACEKSKAFAELINAKTFTQANIRDIKALGYTFILPVKPATL